MTRPLTSPSFPIGLIGNRTIEQAKADLAEQFICPRCKQALGDADEAEGCEDVLCPNQGGCK